ncbi:uncharacterized protein LOC143632189 [Bidens hawaiensis]|uniref:uncharacterized protein LOC143632189 n=1 Tax=Bidens hawaiensis TaxID=980011 RepID=UPI00404B98DB
MSIALSAKNKLGFINNTVPMPANQAHLALWQRCNDMVISWILNTLNHDIHDSVLYAETAQTLWNELNSRYGQASDELNAVNYIPSCTCGAAHAFAKREEDQRLIQFLVGLNPNYDMIRSNILMMQPLPSIDRAYGILIQYEKKREIHTTTTDFCYIFSSMHANTAGPIRGGTRENRRNLVCTHCKRNGHSVSICYTLIGFPKDYKFAKGKRFANLAEEKEQNDKHADQQGITQQQYHDLMVLLQQNKLQPGISNAFAANNATTINHDSFSGIMSCNSSKFSSKWIIDTGANDHMCHDQNLVFSSVSILQNPIFITLPNGTSVTAPFLKSHMFLGEMLNGLYLLEATKTFATNSFLFNKSCNSAVTVETCRTTWTHLLSTKSNAFPILQSFIEIVSNQFGTAVKCIHSDNAFELGTGLVQRAYLLSKGIIHQTTCVAVPKKMVVLNECITICLKHREP